MRVNLKEPVDYVTLETALLGAAVEFGWKSKSKDNPSNPEFDLELRRKIIPSVKTHLSFFKEYETLDSVSVSIFRTPNSKTVSSFKAWYGISGSEEELRKYLIAVQRNLK